MLIKYINVDQVACAEKAIKQREAFGEIMGLAFDALLMSQPGAKNNYGNKTNCSPYLFRGSHHMFADGLPDHDAVLKYNQREPRKEEVPIALISAKGRDWYRFFPGWTDAPDRLRTDTENIMGLLKLTLKNH